MVGTKRSVIARLGLGGAVAMLTLGSVAVPASATPAASSAVHPPSAHYSASGTGDIVAAKVVDLSSDSQFSDGVSGLLEKLGLTATAIGDGMVVHSTTAADSAGLAGGAARTSARATNLDLHLAGQDLSGLGSNVSQSAPPDNAAPAHKELLGVGADSTGGLVGFSVLPATAEAHWAGDDRCVAKNVPLADANNSVASVGVLPYTAGATFVGPDHGAAGTRSTLTLPGTTAFTGGDPRAVKSVTLGSLAEVDLFAGSVKIEVASPPTVTAVATGVAPVPGAPLDDNTAHATSTQPILTVNGQPAIDGMTLGPLSSGAQSLIDALNQVLNPVTANLVLRLPQGKTSVSEDGTTATASAVLFQLAVKVANTDLAVIDVMPLTATASAPKGGLDCIADPIRVIKDADKATVAPGETFNYIITVSNVDPSCVLKNIHVHDTIEAPAGTTVTGTTQPSGTSTISGLEIDWPNIGDLQPGTHTQVTAHVKVSDTAKDGDILHDTAVATGTCDGAGYTAQTKLDKPRVVAVAVLPKVLERTGFDARSELALGLALVVMGANLLALRRLRT